ncbi:MAG: hypothetical protein ACOXZ0_00075 [Eubacteriales bacterium]|jgi:hypothetical protein
MESREKKETFKSYMSNKYYSIIGRIHLFCMVVRLRWIGTFLIILFILENITGWSDFFNRFSIEIMLKDLSFCVTLLIALIIALFVEIIRYQLLARKIIMLSLSKSEKHALKSSIKLTQVDIQSGYKLLFFKRKEDCASGEEFDSCENDNAEDECYVMSNRVNRYLQKGSSTEIYKPHLFIESQSYRLPEEIRLLVPRIMRHNLKKGNKYIYNGQLLRQNQSMYFNEQGKIDPLTLSRVGYYDGQCTHEIVYKNFVSRDHVGVTSGKVLMLNEENQLRPIEHSHSALFLGASTLVFTKDHKILIALQGTKAKVNPNRYVPSGSGSVQWHSDYRVTGYTVLEDVLIHAMEREFCEEWNLPDRSINNIRLKTAIIGYCLLIERGGKPDYFGLTYLDMTYEELSKINKGCFVSGKECVFQQETDEILSFHDADDFCVQLENCCHRNRHNLSIQLYLMTKILCTMVQEGSLTDFLNKLTAL